MKFGKAKEDKILRVGAVSPRIRLADVSANVTECISEAKRAAEQGVRVLVFPELAITGATCRDLFRHSAILDSAERGLSEFIEATEGLDMISLIGLPAGTGGEIYKCVAVVYRGDLIGVALSDNLSSEEKRYFDTPHGDIINVDFAGRPTSFLYEYVFCAPFDKGVTIEIGPSEALDRGSSIVAYSVSSEEDVGARYDRLLFARLSSGRNDRVYVIADAGEGESTTDAVYSANNIIADRGNIVAEAKPFSSDNLIVADVKIAKPKLNHDFDDEIFEENRRYNSEPLPINPFLPTDPDRQTDACLTALEIQARGLAARLERSYSKTMVIGVSGGLDSTLALLVCARATDILGLDRKSIIGVTMPCFGTTKRTRSNAEKLCDALGATFKTVDIKQSVTQHLADIGHDGVTPDVTYENAQARERTQVLMDIANMSSGLVIGTGDLSELVLGWATYNGDHMSMYAVNASVPKTMVRRIVEVYSESKRGDGDVSQILDDILATPVSPELLPPKDGEIAQCTEELVGPYELHDFFIYCTLERGSSPSEVYRLAKESLGHAYDDKTILRWLRVFVRRFISQQFKRSCLPDGPKVSCISVSPRGGLSMPSDASAAVWLEELDRIEKEEK